MQTAPGDPSCLGTLKGAFWHRALLKKKISSSSRHISAGFEQSSCTSKHQGGMGEGCAGVAGPGGGPGGGGGGLAGRGSSTSGAWPGPSPAVSLQRLLLSSAPFHGTYTAICHDLKTTQQDPGVKRTQLHLAAIQHVHCMCSRRHDKCNPLFLPAV